MSLTSVNQTLLRFAQTDGETPSDGPEPVSKTAPSSTHAEGIIEISQKLRDGYTVFVCVAFFAMAWIGVLLGIRIRHLGWHIFRNMDVIRFLVFSIYIFSMCLIFGLGVLLKGVGVYSQARCRIAITVCLVAYVGTKVLFAVFLNERAHVMRMRRPRRRDWVWILAMTGISIGFGIIAVFAFWKPNYAYHRNQRECLIGLPMGIVVGLMCYDLFINVGLTMIFMWLLIPRLRFLFRLTGRFSSGVKGPSDTTGNSLPMKSRSVSVRLTGMGTSRDSSGESREALVFAHVRNKAIEQRAESMQRLAKKTMMGLLVGLIPTMINLALVLSLHGFEHQWLCFTLCTTDVTVQVFIVHWLTMAPAEPEKSGGEGISWA